MPSSWVKPFQLTAARRRLHPLRLGQSGHRQVSTHSRPKAAAILGAKKTPRLRRFNSQPPEGGCIRNTRAIAEAAMFQLTAARRRLRAKLPDYIVDFSVSTHSRPKAAASEQAHHRLI